MRLAILSLVSTVSILILPACDGPGDEAAPEPIAGAVVEIAAGPDAAGRLAEALVEARPGTTIVLGPGTFPCRRGLSIATDDLTLRGAGPEATTLDFAGQKEGAQGILATGDGLEISDLAIVDTAGDGIKVQGATGVVLARLTVWWRGGPKAENGGYGLYPVECAGVLVEDCTVRNASDAGIYLGQSEDSILRRNRVEANVAGIEVENSRRVDVHDNVASGNTGGILVFDLPGLPRQDGGWIRVFDNEVVDNGLANFAPAGNIVAIVPAGTGILVMGNDHVEIFGNRIAGHGTFNLAVVSYHVTALAGRAASPEEVDPRHEPYPEAIDVHDNVFGDGGSSPAPPFGPLLVLLLAGRPIPDIVWDGHRDPDGAGEIPLRTADNGDADLVDLALGDPQTGPSFDGAPFAGRWPSLPPVERPVR